MFSSVFTFFGRATATLLMAFGIIVWWHTIMGGAEDIIAGGQDLFTKLAAFLVVLFLLAWGEETGKSLSQKKNNG